MTDRGGEQTRAPVSSRWPVQCPVDQRWLTTEELCPECGSSTEPLHALSALADSLLARAQTCGDAATAVNLVNEASGLVASTEGFEIAAAEVFDRIGRQDLAIERIQAALQLAPRRPDLLARAEILRNPRRSMRVGRRDSSWGRWAVSSLALVVIGMALGGVLGRAGRGDVSDGPTSEPTLIAGASSPGSSDPGTPEPSLPPAATPVPTGPDLVVAIRQMLGSDTALSQSALAVEQIGETIRVSGPVENAAARARIEDLITGMAPNMRLNFDGLVVPPVRVVFVQRGDTLWSIAARSFGDARRWPEILRANIDIDPGNLRVGQVITIP